MCQLKSYMMYDTTRRSHRNKNMVSWLWWFKNSETFIIMLLTLLIIHSVHSQIIHDDNIAQESSGTEIRVKAPRLVEEPDDRYSYLAGKDLMADETVKKDR